MSDQPFPRRIETLRDLGDRSPGHLRAATGVGDERRGAPRPGGETNGGGGTQRTRPTEDAGGTRAEASAAQVQSGLRLLSGRYLLQERIANGGMASVWRARDEVLARTVAVKLLHDHLAADPDFRERFRREAISAARLSHPFIVGIFDSGVDGDQVFLVMEFVEGVTLRDVIIERGALPPGQVAAIGYKMARALGYAHARGLVHRDVKPANILMGNDGSVKVADFGIAKADQLDDLTKTGMVLGTAAYVAPEQILARPTDGQADQYALGCVLYEMLTGRQPFRAETAVATAAQRLERRTPPVRAVRPEVPIGLDEIVGRAMAREPEDRFPTATELAEKLSVFADDDPERTAALVITGADTQAMAFSAPGPQHEVSARTRRSALPATVPAMTRAAQAQAQQAPAPRLAARMLLPALGVLVFASGLVAALMTGALEVTPDATGRPEGVTAAPAAQALPLAREDLRSFDPLGDDGEEREDAIGLLVDTDPATVWTTSGYQSAEFGNLKDGVGFVIDLGQPQSVEAVHLTLGTPGVALSLYTSDTEPADRPEGAVAQVTAAQTANETRAELRPQEPVEARYVVVWVDPPLPRDATSSRPFRASLAEVTVQGVPAAPSP